jgi:hypothetical protein
LPGPELEPEVSAAAQQLIALTAVPMAEWSEEQVLTWAELVELEPETRAALRTAFEDDGDTDGEELVILTAKRLQKMLKKANLDGDPEAAANAVLALRDALLAPAAAAAPPPAAAAAPPSLRCAFDKRDRLGSGFFGHVFLCKLQGEEGLFAVKRVDAIKAELVTKEVEVLQRAARTCCHANVVQYHGKEEDDDFVYIHMELCDYERAPGGALAACDLAARVGRLAPAEASRAVGELFSGLAYLHRNNIVHRDLKPTNILFKDGVLKICDMGQSRILRGGASVAQTESHGGTEGWRSPEELAAEKLLGDGGVFEPRLSGD